MATAKAHITVHIALKKENVEDDSRVIQVRSTSIIFWILLRARLLLCHSVVLQHVS